MAVDLAFLTIAEASALIKARQLSPVEYVEALIARTETFDPQLHAYITPTFDLARQQAQAGRTRDYGRHLSRAAAWHTIRVERHL